MTLKAHTYYIIFGRHSFPPPPGGATVSYRRGGQTFSTEGHIENFIADGGPHKLYINLSA